MTGSVVLRGEEAEVARAEVTAVLDVVHGGAYKELLEALAERLETSSPLDETQLKELDRLLALALQSGRLRALYGPGGEQAALRAYRKLPGGTELTASATAVSEALNELAGQTLRSVRLSAVGPGAYTLTISAGGSELLVRLDRQGARLASVAI